MQILNSTLKDTDEIFRLYHLATEFQKERYWLHWPEFDREMVETEITALRQWKMMFGDKVACVWATTFDDPQIWEERNADPSVYIHRIATNPEFRGRDLVHTIVAWAKQYALHHDKQFIRMDTVGDNKKLIAHYGKCGFGFAGFLKLKNTAGLPAHYDDATVSLFEIDLNT